MPLSHLGIKQTGNTAASKAPDNCHDRVFLFVVAKATTSDYFSVMSDGDQAYAVSTILTQFPTSILISEWWISKQAAMKRRGARLSLFGDLCRGYLCDKLTTCSSMSTRFYSGFIKIGTNEILRGSSRSRFIRCRCACTVDSTWR